MNPKAVGPEPLEGSPKAPPTPQNGSDTALRGGRGLAPDPNPHANPASPFSWSASRGTRPVARAPCHVSRVTARGPGATGPGSRGSGTACGFAFAFGGGGVARVAYPGNRAITSWKVSNTSCGIPRSAQYLTSDEPFRANT